MAKKAITSCVAGSLVLIPNFHFRKEIKPKYCVLLESWDNGHDDIIAILTTSNMKHRVWKGALFVPKNTVIGLSKDSLMICHDPQTLPKRYFVKAKLVSQLPQDIFEQVLNNLSFARTDPFLVIRVKGLGKFP